MDKPIAKMIGEDGNIFNLMAIAGRSLRSAGQGDKVSQMVAEVTSSKSYDEALFILSKYVEIV